MIKVNAGQSKSTQEISIVVGGVVSEIKPPKCIIIAKTIRTGCPAEDVGIETHAILCIRSDICVVRDVELGRQNKHREFVLHRRHGVLECL